MISWQDIEEQEDEFGPGSDLILSLLAVALLILGLVSAVRTNEEISAEPIPQRVKDQLEALSTRTSDEYTSLDGIEGDILERAAPALASSAGPDLITSIRQARNARPVLETISTRRGNAVDQWTVLEPEGLISALRSMADEALLRRSQIDSLRKVLQEADLRALPDTASVPAPDPTLDPLTIEVVDERSSSLFTIGSADLTPFGRRRLQGQLIVLRSGLNNNTVNSLVISGFASPEPRGTDPQIDANLDLSADRAVAVAHFFHEQGIDYRCLSVEALGRSRSPILNNYLNGRSSRTMETWDRQLRTGNNLEEFTERFEDIAIKERKIIIRAVLNPLSQCTTDLLVVGLKGITLSP